MTIFSKIFAVGRPTSRHCLKIKFGRIILMSQLCPFSKAANVFGFGSVVRRFHLRHSALLHSDMDPNERAPGVKCSGYVYAEEWQYHVG